LTLQPFQLPTPLNLHKSRTLVHWFILSWIFWFWFFFN
jgi:hypothetical protein